MNNDQELRERLVQILIGAGIYYEQGSGLIQQASLLERYIKDGEVHGEADPAPF